uniref:Coiled-coil domain-containing protein 25 n=1 Tax=Oncorhynchus tshawytscha TaxID=74940 RepID=A0AAZ3STJ0_ONCTS
MNMISSNMDGLKTFHVDKLSSAHVYLRMPKGLTIEDIPKEVLIDCVQLVKNNSIQGCKMNNFNVVTMGKPKKNRGHGCRPNRFPSAQGD